MLCLLQYCIPILSACGNWHTIQTKIAPSPAKLQAAILDALLSLLPFPPPYPHIISEQFCSPDTAVQKRDGTAIGGPCHGKTVITPCSENDWESNSTDDDRWEFFWESCCVTLSVNNIYQTSYITRCRIHDMSHIIWHVSWYVIWHIIPHMTIQRIPHMTCYMRQYMTHHMTFHMTHHIALHLTCHVSDDRPHDISNDTLHDTR